DRLLRQAESILQKVPEVQTYSRRTGLQLGGGITELLQLMEDLIGDLTSVPQPIEIKLFSDDEAVLRALAPRVADTISKVRGVVEVKNGIVPAGDALNVEVDRVKVAIEGMDPEVVTKALNDFLAGNVTTRIQEGPKLIGVP